MVNEALTTFEGWRRRRGFHQGAPALDCDVVNAFVSAGFRCQAGGKRWRVSRSGLRSTPMSEAVRMVKQNPATDPVSAAMSAIESALNLTDDDAPTPRRRPSRRRRSARLDAGEVEVADADPQARRPAAEPAPLLRPASSPVADADAGRRSPPRLRPTTTAKRSARSFRR